jgi:hypothetical protein
MVLGQAAFDYVREGCEKLEGKLLDQGDSE